VSAEWPADHVVEVYNLLHTHGIKIWVGGGWGVDALLEKQTREHGDLDIAVQEKDLPVMKKLLAARAYRDKGEPHARPWNFIMEDQSGHEVDVHLITLDGAGNRVYGSAETGVAYPALSLTGRGVIAGRFVQCISPEDMVKFHSGYELDENDFHDVLALCEKFGVDVPEEYIEQGLTLPDSCRTTTSCTHQGRNSPSPEGYRRRASRKTPTHRTGTPHWR
jgi:lincosamide nucleotidyltransferase A/C/D/E